MAAPWIPPSLRPLFGPDLDSMTVRTPAMMRAAGGGRRRHGASAMAGLLIAALLSGLALGACSGPSRRPASTSTTSSTTSTSIATAIPCQSRSFDGLVVSQTSAAGSRVVQVALHPYQTGVRCQLQGTPTVTLLGAGGSPLPTSEMNFSTTTWRGQGNVERPVVVVSSPNGNQSPDAWASFTLTFHEPNEVTRPQTACPATSALAVGLSNDSGTVVIPSVLIVAGTGKTEPCGSIHVGSFYVGLGPQPG